MPAKSSKPSIPVQFKSQRDINCPHKPIVFTNYDPNSLINDVRNSCGTIKLLFSKSLLRKKSRKKYLKKGEKIYIFKHFTTWSRMRLINRLRYDASIRAKKWADTRVKKLIKFLKEKNSTSHLLWDRPTYFSNFRALNYATSIDSVEITHSMEPIPLTFFQNCGTNVR